MPFWTTSIAPRIKRGERLIIAAHGNSVKSPFSILLYIITKRQIHTVFYLLKLRALVKYLDKIPESVITDLNIPTAVPLVYELDEDLNPISQRDALSPLSGRYVGNQDEIKERILGVKVQSYSVQFFLLFLSPSQSLTYLCFYLYIYLGSLRIKQNS